MLLRALIAVLLATGAGGAATSGTPPIVFSADDGPALSGEIYRLDADGTRVDLSKSAFLDEAPTVSPDGRRVAFVSVRDGRAGVYVVGIDGTALERIDEPSHPIGDSAELVRLTWSPDSRALAAVSGDLRSRLTILSPGRTPVVATTAPLVHEPIWSPDGRFVAVQTGGWQETATEVRVFTRAGKLAWRAPCYGDAPGWSRRGLLATVLATRGEARVSVYGEHGLLRFGFRGRTAAWSPRGGRLASVARGTVEIRTARGRVLLRKPLPGLDGRRVVLRWIDDRRLLVSFYPRLRGLDTATGKTFATTSRWFAEPRSPDGRYLADTTRAGSRFAVRVSRLPKGKPRVYGYVPGCLDDGAFVAALTELQFVARRPSLVYQSSCAEPFAALYGVNSDGSGLTRLTQRQEQETLPAWSPDGSRIAYTRYDATGQSCKGCPGSLAVAQADGAGPRVLSTPKDDAYADAGASWSPDGTHILFTRFYFDKASELFVVPAAGGTARALHLPGSAAAWGPTRIAWVDVASQPSSIWTELPDGGDRQKLAEAAGDDAFGSLSWSRDGRLAYRRGHAGAVVIASGGTQHEVQLPLTQIDSLGWSPDATRLVVTGWRVGTAVPDVYTVRTDGTGLLRLTTNLNAVGASWR